MKYIVAISALMISFALPVHADDYEGFAPFVDSTVGSGSGGAPVAIGGGSINLVAYVASCERCMSAGLGDKQPLILMNRPKNNGAIGNGASNAWSGPYEVGWRS